MPEEMKSQILEKIKNYESLSPSSVASIKK